MSYTVSLITTEEKEALVQQYLPKIRYEIKSEIYGCCIKFLSDDPGFRETWQENFYPMSQQVRSHGRLYVVTDPSRSPDTVLFDPYAKTAFLCNFRYYGWVKSIALGLAGDILEDEHEIHSVHGACVDVDGRGLCIVGTSGAGKTTQTYGLLEDIQARIIADDWFFARVYGPDILGYSSEKNFYIREDLATIWKAFGGLVAACEYDADGRAVADIRWVVGKGRLLPMTTVRTVVILKRDPADPRQSRELSPGDALQLLTANNFYNPHLLVRNPRKEKLRTRFFADLLARTRCHVVNTTGTPVETQNLIRSIAEVQALH